MQKGFVKLIILVVIGLIVLKFFFSFDVIDYLDSEQFRSFASRTWEIITTAWDSISAVILYTWNNGKEIISKAFEIIGNIF